MAAACVLYLNPLVSADIETAPKTSQTETTKRKKKEKLLS